MQEPQVDEVWEWEDGKPYVYESYGPYITGDFHKFHELGNASAKYVRKLIDNCKRIGRIVRDPAVLKAGDRVRIALPGGSYEYELEWRMRGGGWYGKQLFGARGSGASINVDTNADRTVILFDTPECPTEAADPAPIGSRWMHKSCGDVGVITERSGRRCGARWENPRRPDHHWVANNLRVDWFLDYCMRIEDEATLAEARSLTGDEMRDIIKSMGASTPLCSASHTIPEGASFSNRLPQPHEPPKPLVCIDCGQPRSHVTVEQCGECLRLAAFSRKVYDPDAHVEACRARDEVSLAYAGIGNRTETQDINQDMCKMQACYMRREARDAARCNEYHRGVLVGWPIKVR